MILLDTNAFLWLESGHERAASLAGGRLALSPASVLEMAYLVEIGKLRPTRVDYVAALSEHPSVRLDDVPSPAWFSRASTLNWPRDPFDRLIAAHALVRRWKLATSDRRILEHLGPDATVAL